MMTLPRNRWLISVTALLFTVSCSGDDEAKNGKSADKTVEKHVPKLHDAEPLKPESLKPLENAPVTPLPQQGHEMKEEVTLTGSIFYKSLEGGFYAFVSEDGNRYSLHGLNEAFQQNGLIVEISGHPKPDMMTTTQYGTVLQVNHVKVLDASRVIGKDGNPTH